MVSAARRMRSLKSKSAPRNCSFSFAVNPPTPPFPSIPLSLWYSHDAERSKYVFAISLHDTQRSMSCMRCFTALSLSFFSIAMTVDVATLAGRLVLYFREVISSNNSCAYHSNRGWPFGKLLLYILMASISSSSSFVSSFFIVRLFFKTLQRYYKKSYYTSF